MLKTLHARLVLVLLCLLLPLGALFVLVTLTTAEQYHQEISQKVSANLANSILQSTNLMIGDVVDTEKLDGLARTLAMTNPNVEIYLVDNTGHIIGSSIAMSKLERADINVAPLEAFIQNRASFPIKSTNPRTQSGQKVFSAAKLEGGKGYLYVILADEQQDTIGRAVQNSTVLRLSLWGGVSVLIATFLLGVLGFTLLTRRLRNLTNTMRDFKESDFLNTETLSASPQPVRDEIDQLTEVFNDMARRISEQLQELRNADSLRRELITNVSHDLRTPLAALQGYLETLQLKETSLSDEQKQQYLAIARRHSERLGKLIGELFELSKLDANATTAQPEPFLLQELIQDILLKFSIAAKENNLKLEFVCAEKVPFVLADIGLIERALTNLVDNAIRYTPAGNMVRIEIVKQVGECVITVHNQGAVIDAEALPQIFDRFYRGSSTDTLGTGLGLAITKRIVALHGADIQVTSTPADGTRFSFALPFA